MTYRYAEDFDELDETPLSIFIGENKLDLVKEFADEEKELFEEFLRLYGEDTHDYILEGFAEYHYRLFNHFCEDKFSDYQDALETEQSLSHYYNVGRFK
jgi:hypothetical protein